MARVWTHSLLARSENFVANFFSNEHFVHIISCVCSSLYTLPANLFDAYINSQILVSKAVVWKASVFPFRWLQFFAVISNKIRWFSFSFFHFVICVRCALGLVPRNCLFTMAYLSFHVRFYYYGCFSTCTISWGFLLLVCVDFSIFRISISLLFSTDSCIIPMVCM